MASATVEQGSEAGLANGNGSTITGPALNGDVHGADKRSQQSALVLPAPSTDPAAPPSESQGSVDADVPARDEHEGAPSGSGDGDDGDADPNTVAAKTGEPAPAPTPAPARAQGRAPVPTLAPAYQALFPSDDENHADETSPSAASSPSSPTASSRVASPVTSPPYWMHSHGRTASTASAESVLPAGAITLLDNEAEGVHEGDNANNTNNSNGGDWTVGRQNSNASDTGMTGSWYGRDRNRACWARSVEITDYVTVNGSATNIGAFVVWNIRVETLSGPYMNIRKRYSEFDEFRRQLVQTFPNFEAAVPALPPKSVISKFRPRFLEKRRAGLQYFLNCILLNPEFSGSPVLKDFLFA